MPSVFGACRKSGLRHARSLIKPQGNTTSRSIGQPTGRRWRRHRQQPLCCVYPPQDPKTMLDRDCHWLAANSREGWWRAPSRRRPSHRRRLASIRPFTLESGRWTTVGFSLSACLLPSQLSPPSAVAEVTDGDAIAIRGRRERIRLPGNKSDALWSFYVALHRGTSIITQQSWFGCRPLPSPARE